MNIRRLLVVGSLFFLAVASCLLLLISTDQRASQAATLIRAVQIALSDAFAFTGNNTHSGTETFTGALNANNLNRTQFADQQAGADACAKILTAFGLGPKVDASGFPALPSTNACAASPMPTGFGSLTLGPQQYNINAPWVMHQGQSVVGNFIGSSGAGNTVLQVTTPWTSGNYAFLFQATGTNFAKIQDLSVNCNNVAGSNGINDPDQEENTVVSNVNINDCTGTYLQVGDGTGGHGQNSGPFERLNITANIAASTSASTLGININVNSTAFRGVHDATVDFHSGTTAPNVCMQINAPGFYYGLHLEGCTTGILVTGSNAKNVVISQVSCNNLATTVTDCVKLAAGSANATVCNISGGLTNLINDTVNSITVPTSSFGATQGCYHQSNSAVGQAPDMFGAMGWAEYSSLQAQLSSVGFDFCQGSTTLHTPICQFNSQPAHPLRLFEVGTCTMASGTCTLTWRNAFSTTPFCVATWNGTGTLTGIVKAVPSTSTCIVTSSVGTDTGVMQIIGTGNPN